MYHNRDTTFLPKQLDNQVLIPYVTHMIWTTDPKKKQNMNYPGAFELIKKLQEDRKDGILWKHIFWTNEVSSVELDKEAC